MSSGREKFTEELTVSPTEQSSFECADCKLESRRVWGYVSDDLNSAIAVYYVTWTPANPSHAPHFDLIVGAWGDTATPADRCVASLELHNFDDGPGFVVVDAVSDTFTKIAKKALVRDEVVGTALAKQLFGLIDAIWTQDPRVAEMRDDISSQNYGRIN